jgi:hypothetical protein
MTAEGTRAPAPPSLSTCAALYSTSHGGITVYIFRSKGFVACTRAVESFHNGIKIRVLRRDFLYR